MIVCIFGIFALIFGSKSAIEEIIAMYQPAVVAATNGTLLNGTHSDGASLNGTLFNVTLLTNGTALN